MSLTLGTAFVWSCPTSWKPGINEGVTVPHLGEVCGVDHSDNGQFPQHRNDLLAV